MNILVASMSNLFLESFEVALKLRRPGWKVSTHKVQTPTFREPLANKIKKQYIDIAVIDITDFQHFSIAMKNLKQLITGNANGVLLVDSKAGEVYHHLKNEKRWTGILKNVGLDEFIYLVEGLKGNILTKKINKTLLETDKRILKELAGGQTMEYLLDAHCLSTAEIEQTIDRINSFFNTPNYFESINRAIEQRIITI